jgi:hypothetical protein
MAPAEVRALETVTFPELVNDMVPENVSAVVVVTLPALETVKLLTWVKGCS